MLGVRFDALLKRHFKVVVVLLVLTAAYFQAKGLSYLVGATLSEAAPVTNRPAPDIPASQEEEPRRPSGDVILSRNPFDSFTGPLVIPEGEAPPPSQTHPLDDPQCEMGAVTLIVWSEEEPDWSFAAVAGPNGVQLRRRGDELGGFHVAHVGPDRIWLTREGRFCQIEVHDARRRQGMPPMAPPQGGQPTTAPPAEGPQKAPPAAAGKRPKGQLPPHIAERIRQTGPNQYDIDRTVVDEILTNQAEYLQKVRVVPEKQGEETTGMRLMGVRKGTALDAIGLKHGDRLQRINGFEMTNPQSALEAYARLMSANQIRVDVVRGGRPTTLELNIK